LALIDLRITKTNGFGTIKMKNETRHIYVDLDGTLIKTDLFFESILKLIKRNPLTIFVIFFWIIKGRCYAKSRIAELINFDVKALPYQTELIDYLKSLKSQGHQIILATASTFRNLLSCGALHVN